MSNRIPAEVFPPGEYIRDELEARGWTQQDLAHILNRPLVAVNQIITGKRSITPETAKGLAAAFGTSAEMWMNLESAYQLAQAEANEGEVSARARLFSLAPINEMMRRGWISTTRDVTVLEGELKRFFECEDLNQIPDIRAAARKSTGYEETTEPQRTWYYRCKRLARAAQVAEYNPNLLRDFIASVKEWTLQPENVRKVPEAMARIGIRLVLVAHLEKTKLDGAALWIDEESRTGPIVGLTLRHDRIDYFWHTLMHELHHIKNRDLAIDSDMDGDGERNELEVKTDAETVAALVPQDKLSSFIVRTSPLYSREKIIQFAGANRVHPGIVVGQLHHIGEPRGLPYRNLRDMLVPVRQLIIGKAMTDGWGHNPGAF